jgi:branched-subunit amino acid transport protein
MNLWLLMILAGLATFATRLSMIFLIEKLDMPDWFRRALRFVPVAILSAIILPELVTRNDALDLSLRNPQLLSGAIAILVAWRSRNVLLTILTGMATLLIIQAWMGSF